MNKRNRLKKLLKEYRFAVLKALPILLEEDIEESDEEFRRLDAFYLEEISKLVSQEEGETSGKKGS